MSVARPMVKGRDSGGTDAIIARFTPAVLAKRNVQPTVMHVKKGPMPCSDAAIPMTHTTVPTAVTIKLCAARGQTRAASRRRRGDGRGAQT